jgi:hypothetical protein
VRPATGKATGRTCITKLERIEMQKENTTETLGQLQQAAVQLAIGFERAVKLDRAKQADAMREASAALIEMRRATDDLAQRLRFGR